MNKFPDDLTDTELVEAAALMHTNLSGAPANYHATAAQATDLLAKSNAFAVEVTAHVAAQAAARSQTQEKNQSRQELEDLMTLLVKQAKLYGASDSDLGKLSVPTGAAGDAPSNATRQAGKVDTSRRLEHLIHFSDEATPDSKRRPRGVLGCEIYRKIGGAPPVAPRKISRSSASLNPTSRSAKASTEKLAVIQTAIAGDICASIQIITLPREPDGQASAPHTTKTLANLRVRGRAFRLKFRQPSDLPRKVPARQSRESAFREYKVARHIVSD
jgi:hypothetical protein